MALVMLMSIFATNGIAKVEAKEGLGPVVITGGQRDFKWPVPGYFALSSCFYDNRIAAGDSKEHYALDIYTGAKVDVVASYDGVVHSIRKNGDGDGGYGNAVLVKHEYVTATGDKIKLYSQYAHLASISVKAGDTVVAGKTVVGKVGGTANGGSPYLIHLDFQILTTSAWGKREEYSIDPYANNLLELPSGIKKGGTTNCCQRYIDLVKDLYAKPLSYADYCKNYPCYREIEVTASKGTYVKSLPCSEDTDPKSLNVEDGPASKGARYQAIGLVENTVGNLWYKVEAKNGKIGYMYAGDTTYLEANTSDIDKSGITAPSNHEQGKTYALTGRVFSQYNRLTHVSVYIYPGSATSGDIETGKKVSVNDYSYSLGGSAIDNATEFNKLATGTHTFVVKGYYENYYATAAKTYGVDTGKKIVYQKTFSVTSGAASCSHSYSSKVTTAATCTQSGVRTYTCQKCSSSYTETIAATGHSYGSWVTTVPAACVTAGTQEKTCASCGDKQAQSISAIGHSYSCTTIPASCVEPQKNVYSCQNCGDTYEQYAQAEYSQWAETKPAGVPEAMIETKTQYRYSNYELTTTFEPTMPGYDLVSQDWQLVKDGSVSYVKSWPSGFNTGHSLYKTYQNTPVSATEGDVEKIQIVSDKISGYLYYHWCRNAYTDGPINRATSPTKTGEYTTFHAFYSTKDPSSLTAAADGDGSYVHANSSCCKDSHWYYVVPVYTQTYQTYQMQYTFARWTDWSAWSDTACTDSATCKVETRTMYRYMLSQLAEHTWDAGVVTQEPTCMTTGTKVYTCGVCNTQVTEAIPETDHIYEGGYCVHCDAVDPDHAFVAAQITVGNASANAGQTVTVPVNITTNPGIAAFLFEVEYDSSAMVLTDVTAGAVLAGGTISKNLELNTVVWRNANNVTGTGVLLYLTFQLQEDGAENNYVVSVALKNGNPSNLVNEKSYPVKVEFTSGNIQLQLPEQPSEPEVPECLSYEIADGQVTITSCDMLASGVLVVPAEIEGYPVTTIGEKAFYNCRQLTKIVIPDSVTSIGVSAFYYCMGLTDIVISKNITSIPETAFQSCTSLKSVQIPDNITTIGKKAFRNCTSLMDVTLSASLNSIGEYAFEKCSSLKEITLPETVESVGTNCFSECTSLTTANIENCRITEVSGGMFVNCTALESITIPVNVHTIGFGAFRFCSALKTVTFGVGVNEIEGYAFSSCTSITDVFYEGTQEQWRMITYSSANTLLYNATRHYKPIAEQDNGTLFVTADGQWPSLTLAVGQTLDLNGKVLTVDSLASFGQIVDSVGGGGLIANNLEISGNDWLPIQDESGCYRFYEYEQESLGTKVTAHGVTFGFASDFADATAYGALLSTEDVQITVTLDWGADSQTFAFSKELVAKYAALLEKYPNAQVAMQLAVTGLDTLADGTVITVTPSVTAVGGKIHKNSESMQYIA